MNIEGYLHTRIGQIAMALFTGKMMSNLYAKRSAFISEVTSTCYRLRESDPRN